MNLSNELIDKAFKELRVGKEAEAHRQMMDSQQLFDKIYYENYLLKDLVSSALLMGKLLLADIPQSVRIREAKGSGFFYGDALRYARESRNINYAIEVLMLIHDDASQAVVLELADNREYRELLSSWFSYISYVIMEFRGDEALERYIQHQKEVYPELFKVCGF
ncbi:hypothetical protein [Streptococcus sp. zg-JUN1979]|uniref:hypothetical protein n=1 Tax=Streptococcus sp. zg-JUN1979 TaxID=3391450 RepID=UPI0039AFA2E1